MTVDVARTLDQQIEHAYQELLSGYMNTVERSRYFGELCTMKKVELGHGHFGKWINSTPYKERTVRHSMKIYKEWDHYVDGMTGQQLLETAKFADLKKPHVSNNSGENEWYTPPEYIEAARRTMGSIDTDPATSETANQNVKAEWIYTKERSGLDKPWVGNVWLNPPYEAKLVKLFSDAVIKKRAEYNQACVLVNNATETGWLQNMIDIADAICLIKTRIKFLDATNTPKNTPLQGQVVLYFGDNTNEFNNQFKELGICLTRM
jgi:ParB family chromosome partitioning protein